MRATPTQCPPLSCGLYYGEDVNGKRVCRGARLGRANALPANPAESSPKLFLRRLRLVDGCYDEAGAYWGAPDNLYRAACYEAEGGLIEVFVRAASRDEAKQHVLALLPRARFYK